MSNICKFSISSEMRKIQIHISCEKFIETKQIKTNIKFNELI